MKGLHLGSYWMGKNDVVYTIADDFEHYHGVKAVDLGIYYTNEKGIVRAHDETESYKTVARVGNAPRREIKHNYLMNLIEEHSPDFIVLNSAGLYLSPSDFELLKSRKITAVCFTLSDPDVFSQNGKFYADKFDLCFTNSKKSLIEQYPQVKEENVFLLPFATSDRCHFPEEHQEKVYDVVVVGHARRDRTPIVKRLQEKYKVGLYGMGWKNGQGVVNGADQRNAINRGKIYLSFAKTMAGHRNVKVGLFEAMACKTVVVTDYMDEVFDYFTSGSEILVYESIDELLEIVDLILEEPERGKWIAENSYKRFIKEHTWEKRLDFVLNKIEFFKEQE